MMALVSAGWTPVKQILLAEVRQPTSGLRATRKVGLNRKHGFGPTMPASGLRAIATASGMPLASGAETVGLTSSPRLSDANPFSRGRNGRGAPELARLLLSTPFPPRNKVRVFGKLVSWLASCLPRVHFFLSVGVSILPIGHRQTPHPRLAFFLRISPAFRRGSG